MKKLIIPLAVFSALSFTGVIEASSIEIGSAVSRSAKAWQLPEPLIHGVIKVESNFNPKAKSPANAIGLMQIVPTSGGREIWKQLYGKDRTPSQKLLEEPEFNIMLGTAYLASIYYKDFGYIANKPVRLAASLAAYNWGPGRVKKLLDRHGVPKSTTEIIALFNRHAPKETSGYVVSVLENSIAYSNGKPVQKIRMPKNDAPILADAQKVAKAVPVTRKSQGIIVNTGERKSINRDTIVVFRQTEETLGGNRMVQK